MNGKYPLLILHVDKSISSLNLNIKASGGYSTTSLSLGSFYKLKLKKYTMVDKDLKDAQS